MTARPPVESYYELLPGTWGWKNYKPASCDVNPQVISFTGDRRTMLVQFTESIVWPVPVQNKTLRYEVLDTKPYLRMMIEGEWRMKDGKPVVWDLVMLSPNRFCWHRADWPLSSCTRAIVRCYGDLSQ
jgi:hypothetical protein